jgi:HD-like signal output (HDOD) protein
MSSPVLDKLILAMRDSKGVPATERSVASVLGALDGGNEGKREVANHIIEDFALTQKVLKLANSSMYAPFGSGSASVSSALDVLGSEAVLHLVLGADLVSEEGLRQDENLSQTLLASELARNACADRTEDASIATLMCEIGRLMSSKYLLAETATIAKKVASGSDPQLAVIEVLGSSYQELGVELAARWNLPQFILSSMDGTGDPTLVSVARFSSSASSLVHAGKTDAVLPLLAQWDLPGVDKSRLGALLSHKAEALQRQRPPHPQAQPAASAERALLALLQTLQQEKKNSMEELAVAMLPGVADALKTAHCLLFMLTRSGEQRVRNGFGKGIDELKTKLRISAEFMPTAFHAAIKNNIDVSIADVSKLKDASLPEGYRELLPHVTQFIILPIASKRVSGLLYCDWDCERLLEPAEMDAMKKLRHLFLPFFPQ